MGMGRCRSQIRAVERECLTLGLGQSRYRDEYDWSKSTSSPKTGVGSQRGSVRWKEAS